MTTTIRSNELDFQEIKESLKTYLKNTGEFEDYDFEASGLSNILDVLAHNTHMNALQANFALNESFLVTAQLRPSVVSLAESLGYVPDSKKSAEIPVDLMVISPQTTAGQNIITAENYTLLPGEVLAIGSNDNRDFTFTNRDTLKAINSNGVYKFFPIESPDDPVMLYEGETRSTKFIVGNETEDVYVIPDQNIDINTAIVRVFENQNTAVTEGSEYSLYTSLLDASSISSTSRLYVLRESPNSYFELSFGNGTSLGLAPSPGNVVEVEYLRTSGKDANNIQEVDLSSEIYMNSVDVTSGTTIKAKLRSSNGGDKEGIESIRKNAPFQFAAQNRMVTADDYSALILKKYSPFIADIQSWGGEDNPDPDYGTVFTSIRWNEEIAQETKASVRQGILALADEFQIASFEMAFIDPIITYVNTQIIFQYNPSLSGLSQSSVREAVDQSVRDYFSDNTGKFSQTFRQSNLLTEVDSTDPSVLSSRATVKISQRFVPQLGTRKDYFLSFPASIRDGVNETGSVISSTKFIYENEQLEISNIPGTTILVAINGNKERKIDNVGSYDPSAGTVTLTSLLVQSLANSDTNELQLTVVPANESVINSVRNNILAYDTSSSARAVLVGTA